MPKKTFFNLSEEKREKIIIVAIGEFAVNGYAKTSINSIVSRAGIAKGSIYQYFDDKKDFYLYLVRFVKENYMSLRTKMIGDIQTQSLRDVLKKTILFFPEYMKVHPQLVRFYFALIGDTSIPFEEEIDRIMTEPSLAYVSSIIAEGQKRGELKSDIDTRMLTFALVAAITAFQQASVDNCVGKYYGIDGKDEIGLSKAADNLLDIILYGIAT